MAYFFSRWFIVYAGPSDRSFLPRFFCVGPKGAKKDIAKIAVVFEAEDVEIEFLIADNPGVGKTISSLYAFTSYLEYREGRLLNLSQLLFSPLASSQPLLHRPSLIMCPGGATEVWKAEIRAYFPNLQLRLYYDSKQRALPEDQKITLFALMKHIGRYFQISRHQH